MRFRTNRLNYLGFVITSAQIRPGRKVVAISDYPTPQTIHEVRRFLGMTGYFRRFIRDYAVFSEPLTRLMRKDTEFVWENEQKEAFNNLKIKLTSEPVLCLFNSNAVVTQVHTDASSRGLAGMLLQGVTE